MDAPPQLTPFPFHLPDSGPLSSPLIRSYLRKQILSIRRHYKRTYYNCNMIFRDGFLSWYAVYSLVRRSGINLRLFTVFSLIVCATDTGKVAVPLDVIYRQFIGIFQRSFLHKALKKLEKINFIKIYRYNPLDPSGPCKYITLTYPGIQFYESFVDALRAYILAPQDNSDDPDYPPVRLPTVPDSHLLRFSDLK